MVTENINLNATLEGNLQKKLQALNVELDKSNKKVVEVGRVLAKIDKGYNTKKKRQEFALFGRKASILGKEIGMVNKELEAMTLAANKAKVPMTKLDTALNFKRNGAGLIDFNGDMLSLMFLGMALRGVFQGALGSIFDGYKSIIPENDKFNRKLTEVVANFEFFKFQLADAFANSGIFTILADSANSLLNMLQGMSEETKKFIVIGLGVGLIISVFLTWLGIMSLGIASLKNLGVKWKTFTSLVKNFSFAELIGKLKAFGSGNFSSVGEFFTSTIKNIKTFIKTAFADGFVKGLKNLFIGIKTGGGLQIAKVLKGVTAIFKLSPLGWIWIGIQSIFESIQSVGDRTFDSALAKATALVISLVINLVENILQGIGDLIDMIYNTIMWAIEGIAGFFDIDFDIPTLDIGGYIDKLGGDLEDLAIGWLESDSSSGTTNNSTTENNYYVVTGDDATDITRDIVENSSEGGDILDPIIK